MAKKDQKINIEKLPNSEVKINFSVSAEDFSEFIQDAAKEISKELKIDGFRSGNIPFDIVKKQVGEKTLLKEGAEKAVQKHYVNIIIDNNIEAVGQPKIEFKKLAINSALEVEAVVSVIPEIEMKKGWESGVKKINEKFSKQKFEVKSEDVERELNFLANQRAKIVTVNREVKKGDQVELDFEAWKDNAPIEGGTAKKHQLIIGEGKFIPGFEDQLIGMKAGEKKDFDLAFPADYHQKNLAGQVTTFKVSVGLVQERELPELNDEFASGIGKFKNLKELKENLNKGMEEEGKKKIQQNQRVEVIEEVIKNVDVELPEILVESEVSRIQKELENDVAKMGLDKKQYIQQLGTTEEKLIEQWKQKEAPNRVKAALIMKKVSNDQKLKPSAKEVEERANVILQQYGAMQKGDMEKDIDIQRLYDSLKAEMMNEKALDYLAKL